MTARPGGAPADTSGPGPWLLDAIRSVSALLIVLVGTAVCLRLLDELPGAAVGVSRGVQRLESIDAISNDTSRRLAVPAFFPDTIAWPPQDVLVFGGTSASVWYRSRTGRESWLIVAAALGRAVVPPELLPPTTTLQSEPTTLRQHPATAERLRDANGAIWQQLTWSAGGDTCLVRYRGSLDELMLIAASLGGRGK